MKKDFYPTQIFEEAAGVARIDFLDCITRGKPDSEFYAYSRIGSKEEFKYWAFNEFGYLRNKIIYFD